MRKKCPHCQSTKVTPPRDDLPLPEIDEPVIGACDIAPGTPLLVCLHCGLWFPREDADE